MKQLGDLHTSKSWAETLADLKKELDKWGVEDYVLPIKAQSRESVTLTFAVNGRWTDVCCRRFSGPRGPERNIRAIYLAVEAVRKMAQRGLGDLLFQAAKPLALTTGVSDVPASARAVWLMTLGISSDEFDWGDPDVLERAYRQKVKETHPDNGGDPEQFKAVQLAAQKLGIR